MSLTLADREFVNAHLLKVSRTFAPGIAQLRPALQEGVGVAYLLCRILDTIEDSAHLDSASRIALLENAAKLSLVDDLAPCYAWADEVARFFASEDNDDGALCRESARVFASLASVSVAQRAAIQRGFAEMARGMAIYTQRSEGGLKIRSFEELREYCYFVAGTVGEILSRLFIEAGGYSSELSEALTSRDVSFGVGLQVVNILKGVKADFERAAHFVPEDMLDAESLSLKALLDDDTSDAARMVAAALVNEAYQNLKEAAAYTLDLPLVDADIRAFCAFPILLALRTCALALKSSHVFPEDNALRVARPEVEAMLAALPTIIADNEALAAAFGKEFQPIDESLKAFDPQA